MKPLLWGIIQHGEVIILDEDVRPLATFSNTGGGGSDERRSSNESGRQEEGWEVDQEAGEEEFIFTITMPISPTLAS